MNDKLTLQELIDLLAARHQMEPHDADAFVREFWTLIEEGLKSDNYVKIKGLGTFKLIDTEARESINIQTGERIEIQSHARITFSPEASLRDLINRPFAHFETVVLNETTNFDDLEVGDEKPDADEDELMAESLADSDLASEPAAEVSEVPESLHTSESIPDSVGNETEASLILEPESEIESENEARAESKANSEFINSEIPEEEQPCEDVSISNEHTSADSLMIEEEQAVDREPLIDDGREVSDVVEASIDSKDTAVEPVEVTGSVDNTEVTGQSVEPTVTVLKTNEPDAADVADTIAKENETVEEVSPTMAETASQADKTEAQGAKNPVERTEVTAEGIAEETLSCFEPSQKTEISQNLNATAESNERQTNNDSFCRKSKRRLSWCVVTCALLVGIVIGGFSSLYIMFSNSGISENIVSSLTHADQNESQETQEQSQTVSEGELRVAKNQALSEVSERVSKETPSRTMDSSYEPESEDEAAKASELGGEDAISETNLEDGVAAKAERQRLEREQAERQRLEREQAERQRLEREQAERKSAETSAAKTTYLSDKVKYKITGTITSYTLRPGETLTRIALKYYGNKKMWPYLVRYNRGVIKNPDNVPIGTTLKIPRLEPVTPQ